MDNQFSIKDVNKYKREMRITFLGHSLKTDTAFSIFDKNHDLKISNTEFSSVNKEEYNSYVESLKNNKTAKDEVFVNYDDLKNFLDCDGTILVKELEGKTRTYGFKGQEIKEVKNLKDSTQMSKEEILSELKSYGFAQQKNISIEKLRTMLNEIRDERSNYDENSTIIDGHIGTFVQGDNAMCTFLSLLDTMSDEQIKDLYEQKTDEKGNLYYEVTFPQDKNTNKSVIVTQEEINNIAINIKEKGKNKEIVGFSMGDADITMLEMAYVKRFGTELFNYGGWIDETKNNVLSENPNNNEFVRNKKLEEIKDFSTIPRNTTISALNIDDLFEKSLSMQYELSDGRNAYISGGKFIISDGTEINMGHAMSVRGFDKETNELVVSGNSFNSSSETRIPKELLKYFEMSLPKYF